MILSELSKSPEWDLHHCKLALLWITRPWQ